MGSYFIDDGRDIKESIPQGPSPTKKKKKKEGLASEEEGLQIFLCPNFFCQLGVDTLLREDTEALIYRRRVP